jgi:hypothetical protein
LALVERSKVGERVLVAQFWRPTVPDGRAVVKELVSKEPVSKEQSARV